MRAARRVLVLVLAGVLAIGLAVLNFADFAARSRNPVLLAAAAPFSPNAAALAGEMQLAAENEAAAEALARRSLDGALLSARALRTLGFAREAQGDGAGAAEAMALAGGLGWRDTPAQAWLIDAYLRQGDYRSALERVDALARRRQLLDETEAILMAAALDPAARAALGERLANEPPWRAAFFESAHRLPPKSFDAFAAFLADFTQTRRLRPEEAEGFVTNLYREGEYARARDIWFRHAGDSNGDRENALFDSDFALAEPDRTGHRSPFEWSFAQPPGSETRLGRAPGREGERALHAESRGNARFEIAEQATVLGPGRYVLAVDATAEPGTRLEGFSWILNCLPSHQMLVPAERRVPLSDGWTQVLYAFQIPSAGCEAQSLKLVLRGGQPRPLSLWFDRVVARPDA